jgi:hypothetical protein
MEIDSDRYPNKKEAVPLFETASFFVEEYSDFL